MANENPKPPVLPSVPGGAPATANNGPITPPVTKPVSDVPPVDKSPALFGGHRGGGKKRSDGLVAGSPEAIEADRKADAARKRVERATKKKTSLPPTLPSATPSTANAVDKVAVHPTAESGPVAPTADAPVAPAPMFVPWQVKTLERTVAFLVGIIDRVRCWSLMKHVRKLKLSPQREKQVEDSIQWKEKTTQDFRAALAEGAAIELNKRRVPGAENSHIFNVVLCGGELVIAHIQSMELIERLVLEEKTATTAPPANN